MKPDQLLMTIDIPLGNIVYLVYVLLKGDKTIRCYGVAKGSFLDSGRGLTFHSSLAGQENRYAPGPDGRTDLGSWVWAGLLELLDLVSGNDLEAKRKLIEETEVFLDFWACNRTEESDRP